MRYALVFSISLLSLSGGLQAAPEGWAGSAEKIALDGPVADAPAPSIPAATPTVRYRWPGLATEFNPLIYYRDLDPSTNLQDWDCHQTTYDGHNGYDLDYGDFVAMDEGRFIVAAAPGTVTSVTDGYFDRQIAWTGAQANFVIVRSSDNTDTWYYHLRKWSTMVTPGDVVVEGQPLGLMGSSGQSRGPHLHFQVNNGGTVYDPSDGACNSAPSLWKAQKPDVFFEPAIAWSSGLTTISPSYDSLKERPPDVTHVYHHGFAVSYYFWVKLQNVHALDVSRVIFRRPDGTVHSNFTLTHNEFCSICYYWWVASLPTTGLDGIWTVEYSMNSVLQRTQPFLLDGTPYADPVAASFEQSVTKGIAEGSMSGSDADSGIAWWLIASQPAHGKISFYGPRNRFYKYVPEAGFSGNDSFEFVVQDGQGVQSEPATGTFTVTPALPNTLRCEGESDGASLGGNGTLNVVGALTIEAWIKREPGSSGFQVILDHRATFGGTQGYSLMLTPTENLRFQIGNGSVSTVLVGTSAIPLSKWTHVAATWDGTTMRVYVNGAQDGSLAFSNAIAYSSVTTALIGHSQITSDEGFRGEIDELRVWSVARTASELQAGMTCSFFEGAAPSTLKARWPFNGDLTDATGNGNNVALAGNATLFRTVDSGVPTTCNTDLDGDGVADATDRCPLDLDAGQADSDGDGVGDACDLCPSLPGRGQYDSDFDGVGDACDDCPFLGDTAQVETDADGSGNDCDPAPYDASDAVPSAAITMTIGKPSAGSPTAQLAWTAEPKAQSYEVYRGGLSDVRSLFYGTCQNVRDADVLDTAFTETDVPDPGTGYYFLVIGVSPSGTRGRAGVATSGQERDLRARDCL